MVPGFSLLRDHATLMLPEDQMANLTISLPDAAKDWIEQQIRDGRYKDAGDYLNELVTQERARHGEELSLEEVRHLLEASRRSGISRRGVSEIFAEAEKVAEQRKAGRA